jgi:hypothetical protein
MERWKLVLFLGIILTFGISSGVRAETKTMSWEPVTTYNDNSSISGAALPVSYDAWWSTSSSFTSPHMLLTNGTASSVAFDVVTQSMVRGTTIYFGARARTALGETSVDAPPYSWAVPNLGLVSLSITAGPATVNESSTATYTAKATWSDGSTSTVSASWSVAPTSNCSINSSGTLTTGAVTADQALVITASFTADGITKSATKNVTLLNSNRPTAPRGLGIN